MTSAAATARDDAWVDSLVTALAATGRAAAQAAELDALMAKFIDDFGPSVAGIVSAAECVVGGIATLRLSEYLGRHTEPSMFVMARHVDRGGFVLVRMGGDALDWWVSSALGGAPAGAGPASRPISAVEARLGRVAVDLALQSLVRVLSSLDINADFHEGRVATHARDVPTVADDPWITVVTFGLSRAEDGPALDLVVSQELAADWSTVLVALADADDSAAQAKSPDKTWIDGMEAQLSAVSVPVEAVLCHQVVGLDDIASWSLGRTLPLDVTAAAPVRLVANGVPLVVGELGKRGGVLCVRIGAALDHEFDVSGALGTGRAA